MGVEFSFWHEVVLSMVAICSGLTVALFLLKFATRKACTWRLEGVMQEGHVVETCDGCGRRRVYAVSDGKPIQLKEYSRAAWEAGSAGKAVDDG